MIDFHLTLQTSSLVSSETRTLLLTQDSSVIDKIVAFVAGLEAPRAKPVVVVDVDTERASNYTFSVAVTEEFKSAALASETLGCRTNEVSNLLCKAAHAEKRAKVRGVTFMYLDDYLQELNPEPAELKWPCGLCGGSFLSDDLGGSLKQEDGSWAYFCPACWPSVPKPEPKPPTLTPIGAAVLKRVVPKTLSDEIILDQTLVS